MCRLHVFPNLACMILVTVGTVVTLELEVTVVTVVTLVTVVTVNILVSVVTFFGGKILYF